MENTGTKWFAAVLGVLIIMLMFSVTQNIRTARPNKAMEEIFQVSMPRPIKEMILGFSLEGRNIIREIEASVVGVTSSPAAKKSATVAKKVDPKAQQKSKLQAAQQAAAKKRAELNEQRRKAFETRVIEQAERYRQSLRLQEQAQYIAANQPENMIQQQQKEKKQNANNDVKLPEREKVTSAEWKSLILAQPTKANVQKMIEALPEGEIEIETYLEISESLIKDNSQEKRKMGAWALTSVYRQEAFVMAAHLAQETDATTQKTLNDYIYNYNRPQTITILDQVLKSQDSVAAAAAAQSITKSIQVIQASQSGQSNGGSKNTGSQMTMTTYQRLVPTLKMITAKNLNNLSQWAQTILSQLQRASTTA